MHDIGTYICGKTTPPLNCGGGCGETMVIFSFLFHDLGKCDYTMQNRILRHFLQENWTWKSRVFPNLTKTTKLYRIYPFPILAKYLYFSRADTCDNDGFNSFCSCTTTKILRLKIKRFFPRIISNRYIHKYMTNIYSTIFLHLMNSQGKNNEKISHLFRRKK